MTNLIKRNFPKLSNSFQDEITTPISKIFDDFINDEIPDIAKIFNKGIFSKGSYPKIDIIDYDDRIEIVAEIHGYDKKDIKIKLQDNILTICGKINKDNSFEKTEKNGGRFLYNEIKRSSFGRSVELSEDLDTTKLSAKFENGELNVIIPKKLDYLDMKREKEIEIK